MAFVGSSKVFVVSPSLGGYRSDDVRAFGIGNDRQLPLVSLALVVLVAAVSCNRGSAPKSPG